MPEELPESNLCQNCGGSGLDGTDFCLPCAGTGYVSSQGISIYRKNLQKKINDMEDKINDILDKCNDIFEKVDV